MKALIYKDFCNNKKQMLISLVMMSLIFGFMNSNMDFIPFAFGFVCTMNLFASFGYDEKSELDYFLLSSPISRFQIVLSRYVFIILFVIAEVVIGGAVNLALGGKFELYTQFFFAAFLFTFGSHLIPILIKYGVEKGRIIFVITYLVFFVILQFGMKEMGNNILSILSVVNMDVLSTVFFVISLVVTGISIFISHRIYLNKEI